MPFPKLLQCPSTMSSLESPSLSHERNLAMVVNLRTCSRPAAATLIPYLRMTSTSRSTEPTMSERRKCWGNWVWVTLVSPVCGREIVLVSLYSRCSIVLLSFVLLVSFLLTVCRSSLVYNKFCVVVFDWLAICCSIRLLNRSSSALLNASVQFLISSIL